MTQSLTPEQQFLMGGESVPSAFNKDDGVGTRRGGKITERPELRQQTDFDTGKKLVWDNGDPRMHLVVTVQTDQRDPRKDDDDGRRRFYIKGDLQAKTRDELRRIGAAGLEVGGLYFVTRTGRDEPKKRGMDGAWLHSVEYTPAAAAFVAEPVAQPAPPTAAAAGIPAQQNGAVSELEAALAKLPPEQAAAFRAANLTLDGIRAMGVQV